MINGVVRNAMHFLKRVRQGHILHYQGVKFRPYERQESKEDCKVLDQIALVCLDQNILVYKRKDDQNHCFLLFREEDISQSNPLQRI